VIALDANPIASLNSLDFALLALVSSLAGTIYYLWQVKINGKVDKNVYAAHLEQVEKDRRDAKEALGIMAAKVDEIDRKTNQQMAILAEQTGLLKGLAQSDAIRRHTPLPGRYRG
jgi:hypothetical protein